MELELNRIFEKSKVVANRAHEGQFRKMGDDKGKPYIVHPERVADKFPNDKILASVAILHDVLEDTPWTDMDLYNEGIPAYIVEAIWALTKREGENYLDFILRAKKNELALPVKIADIKDNMISLQEGSLKDKYRLALYILEH